MSDDLIWQRARLKQTSTIQAAISNLDAVGIKIVLVVNEKEEFIGTISDGDIRRALLKGMSLNSTIENVVHKNALVVPPDMDRNLVMQLMKVNKVHQIPVVDLSNNVVGLHLWDHITNPPERSNTMVIMAGGKGTRLRPYTENCPKPMLLIAGKPMLEHIIQKAINDGFNHFVLAIYYLGYMIEDYFGDGSNLNVKIEYLKEDKPLGTAGALSLMFPKPTSPILVTNGDVMTSIRYGELIDFHAAHQADATMAVRTHEWQHPFGVVQTNGVKIIGFEEKPILRTHINAGVYALNPSVFDYIEYGVYCDMPTLFERIKLKNGLTIAYPMHESWLDVGRPDDLSLANENETIRTGM